MERKQIRLGILGYGDIGSSIGSGLKKEGLASIVAYDIAAFDGKFHELIQRRAREANVELVRSPAKLAQKADYIITAVAGIDSVAAAESVAPFLTEGHHYIDIASATPKVKQRVAAALASSKAQVADGGIEGSAMRDGYLIPILISGPAAQEFHDVLTPWNMKLQVVGPEIGRGSAIKILRSVIVKGIETLVIECGLAAERYGLRDEVFKSVIAQVDGRTFGPYINGLLTANVVHAERRFHELEMSAEALEDVGIEPIMTRGTVERLHQIAQMGLKEHFGGVVPDDYRVALEAIAERLPAYEKAGV